jgi:ubiquinone biosynthesis protein
LLLVNARHIKQVPGRKTDVRDCEWIANLLRLGLLRASFVPVRSQRELRQLTRYRTSLIRERAAEMASSQSQTLPADWVAELAKLQSDVPPVPYDQAREVVISELGKPPEELYATFEHEALAAASTAQVHRATLHNGTLVAVKVQRPNIVASVKADLAVLQDVSIVVENVSGSARDLDVSGILAEFSDGVIRDLDYQNEAYHARRLADILESLPLVHVPTVYPDLSGTRVLTMEFVNGVKVDGPGALDRPDIDRLELTQAFMRALIKQIFIDGFFHGDPHPGNILLDPDTGALTYIDFGLVGRLDQTKRLGPTRYFRFNKPTR